ncbi:MAG: hypothetical protein AVDCRST_MAG30-2884 [uncultured Solirubrobacteraceae bacterium]|uniref:Uncharacterized protein n=1 Tax=uncultured Solirubrobacteraceae bacterium TaxID=1162706 RepID=A0A6J4TBL2_9ACTN|nr:MAG: hypothetical protein AVDCRST_MAG30-2884 [uncultured Solirubrobacteraceae bacterium]
MLSSVSQPVDPRVEVVDGEPVTGSAVAPVEPAGALEVPTRHVAALAATGFVAGAATVAVFGRRGRGGVLRRRKRRRKGVLGEVVSSNSFLVDVHVLKR